LVTSSESPNESFTFSGGRPDNLSLLVRTVFAQNVRGLKSARS
jgi:hypothetical protein